MDIFDYFKSDVIATYYKNDPSNNVPYLGKALFPAQRFKSVETEMPFFRESMRIGEKDRQQLLQVQASNNANYAKGIMQRIYADTTNLVNGAEVNAERMRMQLLSTGKIEITANGLSYKYDYKFKSDNKTSITDAAKKWSDTDTATPVQDIIAWQDAIEDATGVRPTRAICTRKTWGYLLNNKSIRLDLNPIGGQNIIMTDNLLQTYLADKLGLSISVYNKKYLGSVGGAAGSFFPDNVFTLIPPGNLGTTYFGTTPEEADLIGGNTQASVSLVNTGVAITTFKEVHPVNSVTVVSAIVLPSFESIDNVFIATVA